MDPLERALLANVAAAPDDDAPRLVYADWLGDRGDPRGELVVVQCALARADRDDAPEPVCAALREREAALLAQHRDAWFEPLLEIAVGTYLHRRGLVERLDVLQPTIDGARLHAAVPLLRAIRTSHLADLSAYASALPIEELTLYDLTDLALATRACEHADLARVRRLDLHFRNADAEVSREAVARNLQLARYGIHAPVLRAADPPMLLDTVLPAARGRLRSLHFSRIRLDDLRPLGALVALEELVLAGCQLSIDQLAAVALPGLRSLAITDRSLTAAELAALLDAFPHLRRLRLARDGLDNSAAATLAAHPGATHLRRLDLGGNRIEAAGARALEGSALLATLSTLELAGNPHDPAIAARIRHAMLGRGGPHE